MKANGRADSLYIFRVNLHRKWKPLGVFASDEEAQKFVMKSKPVKDGRLAVEIGKGKDQFAFPIFDLQKGEWVTCKTHKSY